MSQAITPNQHKEEPKGFITLTGILSEGAKVLLGIVGDNWYWLDYPEADVRVGGYGKYRIIDVVDQFGYHWNRVSLGYKAIIKVDGVEEKLPVADQWERRTKIVNIF